MICKLYDIIDLYISSCMKFPTYVLSCLDSCCEIAKISLFNAIELCCAKTYLKLTADSIKYIGANTECPNRPLVGAAQAGAQVGAQIWCPTK